MANREFIPDIYIAPLQVHYYSEALQTIQYRAYNIVAVSVLTRRSNYGVRPMQLIMAIAVLLPKGDCPRDLSLGFPG